jgi:hypothetical protein
MSGPSRTSSRYSAEQLEKIRETLANTLGSESAQVLKDMERRIRPKEETPDFEEDGTVAAASDPAAAKGVAGLGQLNIPRLVQAGNIEKMLEALPQVVDNPQFTRMIVAAILKHPDAKQFHMADALNKVYKDVELVNALVHGMVTRKGVNPLIDSIRFVGESPPAMKALAVAICEQGTVNHMIRALANSKGNPDAENILAMEVMDKGTLDQMQEAMKLMDSQSPGMVILATGLIARENVPVEQLVRGLMAGKDNEPAANLLAVEVAKVADVTSLLSALEKYVRDTTEAGEIVTARIIQNGRAKQLLSACRHVTTGSNASLMLAVGITKKGTPEDVYRGFRMMAANPQAKQILGLDLVRQKGKFMAMRQLGSEVFELVKKQNDIQQFAAKAWHRYNYLLQTFFGDASSQTPATEQPPPKA